MSDRTATPRRTSGDEPARRSLTGRLQDTLSNAAEEHRANADSKAPRGNRARRASGRQPRRARLRLTRIDPWSVMKTSFLLSVAFGVVTFVAIALVTSGGDDEQPPARVTLFDGIPQDGAWLGRADAPVVVEEYADLQCPFCAAFSKDGLPQVVSEHVKTGQVRMRLRLLTFIGAFNDFGTILVLTKGGPANATMVLSYLIYQTLTLNLRFGRGAALALLVVFFLVAFSILYLLALRRRSIEEV